MDLKSCCVLVTPTSYGKKDALLISELEAKVGEVIYNHSGKPLTSAELSQLLPGIDGYIAGLDQIDDAALKSADRLKVISRYGVGVDNVDMEVAKEKDIVVTNTPGANSGSVAELALGLMLSLARQIPTAAESTRRGEWPRLPGLSISGKTIGILGLGAIGKELAKRLIGFDCQILAYDPYPDQNFCEKYGIEVIPMDQVLASADFLSLNLPLLPKTRGLVDDAFLNKVKLGAYLVNTARGEIIDEDALLRALQSGKIGGAALDAFSQEPPDPANPLLASEKIIVTPHMGAHTDGAMNNMGWMALTDCLAVLSGGEPKYRVA